MKKTLLAAALVTGFAGVAHAESSVTLYGLVDAGYGYQGVETKYRGAYPGGKITQRDFGVHSGVMNGSRWGLKGSEDLGNGTSAIFVLESGFDVNDGTQGQGKVTNHRVVVGQDVNGDPIYGTLKTKEDRLFGRQAYVGLTGDSWGTFTIGRQYNAGDTFVAPIDPFGTGGGFAASNTIFGDSVSGRYDGVIKYVTPNFSGFQFGLGLVHDDSETKYRGSAALPSADYKVTARTVGVSTGLGYTNGPIYVGVSFDYIDQKNSSTITVPVGSSYSTRHKTKAWNIGGTYDLDVVKLHLLYGGQADGSIGGVGDLAEAAWLNSPVGLGGFDGDGLKQHSWLAGLSAPVGDAGKVMFSYAGNTVKNSDVVDGLKVKSHNFALGYRHSLSKRTSVYGVTSYGWSEGKDRTGFVVSGTGKTKVTATQAIIGLQHRF